jgi:hypothetical protein
MPPSYPAAKRHLAFSKRDAAGLRKYLFSLAPDLERLPPFAIQAGKHGEL